MSASKEVILFVGNPGVGKSTWLNMFTGTTCFKGGYSFGGGLTQNLQLCEVGNTIYGDTPGFDDISRREAAAKEIERGLKQNGKYKLIFFVTLEACRVRSVDAAMIQVILDAIKVDVPFGIVINKISKKVSQEMEKNPENLKSVVAGLLSTSRRQTRFIHTLALDKSLDVAHSVVPPHNQGLVDFVSNIPFLIVPKEEVGEIEVRDFDKLQQQKEKEINELRASLEKTAEFINKLEERTREDKLEQERHSQRMQEDYDRKIAELYKQRDNEIMIMRECQQRLDEANSRNHAVVVEMLERQIKIVQSQKHHEGYTGIFQGIVGGVCKLIGF